MTIPDHTCPDIDSVIDDFKAIFKIADRNAFDTSPRDMNEHLDEIKSLADANWGPRCTLENLRHANSKLRDAAEGYKERCEELERAMREAGVPIPY